MIKVGIIEDDHGIRRYVCEFLNMQPDMTCVAVHDSVEDFLENVAHYTQLNVLLLDINLPKMSGMEALKPLKKALPHVEIVMLTIHSGGELVFQALCGGATGYLLKSAPLHTVAQAIRSHAEGGSVMSPTIARMVIEHFNPSITNNSNELHALSTRELQVLEALAEGLSYKLIANRLQMSANTLPVHIRNIYKKLQINSKAEAIALYHRNLSRR